MSGQNPVSMTALKDIFENLGFENVRTYLQSGNVVFDRQPEERGGLMEKIRAEIIKHLGLSLTLILREAGEFTRLAASNPFIVERGLDTTNLYVTLLQSLPDAALAAALAAPPGSDDDFILRGDVIFLYCPNGYGRTKLNNNFFERKLKVPATTRNWRTVMALMEMAS